MIQFGGKKEREKSNLRYRIIVAAGGLFIAAVGYAYLRGGTFAFKNVGYHQTIFTAGIIATGVLIALLACIPTGDWLYQRITTKHQMPHRLRSRRSKRSQ